MELDHLKFFLSYSHHGEKVEINLDDSFYFVVNHYQLALDYFFSHELYHIEFYLSYY